MTIENRFPTLETARLLLREIVPTDSNALFSIHGDVEHMRWFGADAPAIVEDAAKLIDIFAGWRNLPNPGTRWGIERQSDGVFIGTCGLFKWNKGWSSCTIGYELAPTAQGCGYMQEALLAVLAYGFDEMDLHRIDASVSPENVRSINVLTGLGFLQEGRSREAGYWAGSHHDLLQFGLLRRDFTKQSDEPAVHVERPLSENLNGR
jgi:ribosomal-protein-alanine N-acetyltransferase